MSPGFLRSNLRPADGTGGADGHGQPSRHVRFGLLLLVLMTTYLLSAFVKGSWVSGLQILLFVWVTALAVHSGDVKRGMARLMIAAAIGGSAIAITLALTHSSGAVGGVGFGWGAVMLLFAVALIIRRVLEQPDVTLQSIFGAVSAYMILGLMFAATYAAVYHFSGQFFVQRGHNDLKTFQYFSFTTLTTLGYGDFTAAGNGGRAFAVLEALTGQIFLATLVARLVAAYRGSDRRP
jgi:Ion channel